MTATTSLKQSVVEAIDADRDALLGLSRDIWRCKGVCFEEHEAVEVILGYLRRHAGVEIEAGTGGLETAFRATVTGRSGGPHVAMLAEYDAVPGLGHACGHNIISGSMVGALVALLPRMKDLFGRFSIYGTPAEEGGGGKMIMFDNGAFEGVDAVLMFHPKDINTVGQTTFALTPVTIEFHGHSVNASSFPFQGINALDALVNTYVAISTLRQQLKADARVHGIITHGGVAPNNIPDFARAEYYCRATEKAYVAELVEKVKNCARGSALQTGCRVEFPEPGRPPYDPIKPNPILVDLMRRNSLDLGIPLVEDEPVLTASNDAGTLSQVIPTTLLTLAIGPRPFGEHSPEFAEAAIAEAGDAALMNAARVLAMTAVDILSDPRVVEDAKQRL